MRFSVVTGPFVLFGEGVLAEDETPLREVSLQYQMLHLNSSRSIASFTANGGTSSFQINFSDHLAAIAQLGPEHNGNIHNLQLDNTWRNYLFGPRVSSMKRCSRIVPTLESLLGKANVAGSIKWSLLADIPGTRITGGQSAFAAAVGDALDIRLNRHLTLRPVESDCLLTRLQSKTPLNGI